jgi:steroid delta-isomerase-like uncharacterized protein
MSETNKAVVRRIFEECINKGNLQTANELVATNYSYHEPTVGNVKGRDGFQQLVTQYRTAFPDLKMTINRQFADGDFVITHWTANGTQRGELFGVKPTNKRCTCDGIMITRLTNGKIVEDIEQWDVFGLLRQIGAVPASVKVAA